MSTRLDALSAQDKVNLGELVIASFTERASAVLNRDGGLKYLREQGWSDGEILDALRDADHDDDPLDDEPTDMDGR